MWFSVAPRHLIELPTGIVYRLIFSLPLPHLASLLSNIGFSIRKKLPILVLYLFFLKVFLKAEATFYP